MMATVQLPALTHSEFQQLAADLVPQQRQLLELLFTGASKRKGMTERTLADAAPRIRVRTAQARKIRDQALAALKLKDSAMHDRLVSKGIRRQ